MATVEGKWKRITILVLSLFLALVFLLDLGVKQLFSGRGITDLEWVDVSPWFANSWFVHVVGVIQLVGAVALLFPQIRCYGASLLAVDMLGAAATHLIAPQANRSPVPVVLCISSIVVASLIRPALGRYLLHLVLATLAVGILAYRGALAFSLEVQRIWQVAFLGAAAIGYFVNRKTKDSSAGFVWVLPLIQFLVAFYTLLVSYSWPNQTLLKYFRDIFFGIHGYKDPFFLLFLATPLISSLAYSVGAFLALRRDKGTATLETQV
jgi:hypothetical protein